MKLSKCIFGSDKVDFLGFELSQQGLKPQSRLKEAIDSFKHPYPKRELYVDTSPCAAFCIYDPMHVVVSFLVRPGYTPAGTTRLYVVFTIYSYQDESTNYR